ncbi:MAG: phage terminase large subunit family protein [Pseudomonadota bacterium]|nr:phage terminase large subunit family protein [Pseudomonadota bacterium]
MVLEAAWSAAFAPRPIIRTQDWAIEHAQTEHGQPYDADAYPHLGAPGGPMDALDCAQYCELWLQWAARLGKSFVGQVYAMKVAACDPCPMMLAGPNSQLSLQISGRTERMLEHCDVLAGQLLPESRRSAKVIELAYCRMFVAWPRSAATLADKAVRFGHAAEIDKWEHLKTSTEADPLELFDERFKEFEWAHKKLKESTPALKHSSRIERGRLASCNAHLWVPCPHCGRRQALRLGDGKRPGGIVWQPGPGGRSDKHLARQTAKYVCLHCEQEIGDEHRGSMMRGGVWIPEGCGCDDEKARAAVEAWRKPGRPLWGGFTLDAPWLTGEPVRDGRDYGTQLSSLYALSLTWGAIAAKFVGCKDRPHQLRNFVNSWKGETWELVRREATWETLGQRLMALPLERGQLPEWTRWIVAGVDKQESHYPVVAEAWNAAADTSHTLDYGRIENENDLLDWLAMEFPSPDGSRLLRISLVLMDFGFRPRDVHRFIERAKQRGITIIPCRGSRSSLGALYKRQKLGKNTSKPGAKYIEVDTISTQDQIDSQLHDIVPGSPGGTTLFRAALEEQRDFLDQLLNDAPVGKLDDRNEIRESWQRIDDQTPNDYRDAKRYGIVAAAIRKAGHDGQPADHTGEGWFAQQKKARR